MTAVAQRASVPSEPVTFAVGAPSTPVARGDDPMPPGFIVRPGVRVPIGWVDAGGDPQTNRAWIGGDVLAPKRLLSAIAAGAEPDADFPLEGATLRDLREAASLAAQ
jgi:hypothetical protein